MGREILLNAFEMNCVAHQSPGLWRHPRDRSRDYRGLKPWIALAQTLERGLFDGLFLADVLGVYDVFGGNADAALAHACSPTTAATPIPSGRDADVGLDRDRLLCARSRLDGSTRRERRRPYRAGEHHLRRPDRRWTVREVAEHVSIGGIGPWW